MKRLLTSLGLALLTSTAAVAAVDPNAATGAPAAAVHTEGASAASARPSEERIALARSFVALTMPEEDRLNQFRDVALQAASVYLLESDDASDRADVERFLDHLMIKAAPVIREHMLSIAEVTAVAYAREFSPAELQEMIAFARTPGGKHYFARYQLVDMDPVIMAQVRLLHEAMRPAVSDVRKEMCQEATAQRIAAGDKKAKCPLADAKETQDG